MSNDAWDLDRFTEAQERTFAGALAELRRGSKQSHWMWFIFPQLQGLGTSAMAQRYGISGLAEARAYLAHPVLGPRLIECVEAMQNHPGRSARAILGEIDAVKFRSCLTLFSLAAPGVPAFDQALSQFFGGWPDPRTQELLAARDDG